MRILQIVHSLPLFSQAGAEIYAYNLSLELSKKHQIFIFSRLCNLKYKDYSVTKEIINGITVYLINHNFSNCESFQMLYEDPVIDQKFEEILEEVKPDVVHVHHLVFLSIGIIKKIKEKGIPVVFTLHDYWLICPRWHVLKKNSKVCEKFAFGKFDQECLDCLNELLNIKKETKKIYNFIKKTLPGFILVWFKRMYFSLTGVFYNGNDINKLQERASRIRELMKSIDIFLAPSEFIRKRYIEFGIPKEKIKLSRYGLNTSLFNELQKKKNNKLRFAFLGTLLPAKGVDVLIKSFNRIKDQNAKLMIYGALKSYLGFEYYLPYLKKIRKNKNITFMGGFDNRQIASVFQNIDVLIVPSIWPENSPLVIQEAFLAKIPVIASRIGGIPELIQDGINGLLFNPADAQELHGKIQDIIDHHELIEKFKKNIPDVKTIEDNVAELEQIYKKIYES
jgi:glycosyltransferase involved in cell wall biosynthesis